MTAAPRPNPSGFTRELMKLCRENCALYGDPPCWSLPHLVDDCEPIAPCADCLAGRVLEE